MKNFLKGHWSNSYDFCESDCNDTILNCTSYYADKRQGHQIIGKSNPITKVEVEVDGLLYFTSK